MSSEKLTIKDNPTKVLEAIVEEHSIDTINDFFKSEQKESEKNLAIMYVKEEINNNILFSKMMKNDNYKKKIDSYVDLELKINPLRSGYSMDILKDGYTKKVREIMSSCQCCYDEIERKTNIFQLTKMRKLSYEYFIDLTKHDTNPDPSLLTDEEKKQALNNSITKFKDLHTLQTHIPQQLKRDIQNNQIAIIDTLEVVHNHINHPQDIIKLNELFREYKQDTKGIIYNYSLFAFIYYLYSFKVSVHYLYNSSLLKLLELYTVQKNRRIPTIKETAVEELKKLKIIIQDLEDSESVFIDNFIMFIDNYIASKYNYYSITYLVNDLENDIRKSRGFIESIEAKSYKNVKESMLPKTINTLLQPPQKIINY